MAGFAEPTAADLARAQRLMLAGFYHQVLGVRHHRGPRSVCGDRWRPHRPVFDKADLVDAKADLWNTQVHQKVGEIRVPVDIQQQGLTADKKRGPPSPRRVGTNRARRPQNRKNS
jgi:hypothetical protein